MQYLLKFLRPLCLNLMQIQLTTVYIYICSVYRYVTIKMNVEFISFEGKINLLINFICSYCLQDNPAVLFKVHKTTVQNKKKKEK